VSDLATRVYEVEKAISLTREHAPEYVEWHADVVQAMAGLPIITEGTVTSRTVPGQIGIVYVSSPCWGIRMAESLIHEAAHQYFYAAFQELFWTNLEDEKLYYSPYKKMDRPIERILLAYHAFANIVLFYRKVLATTTQERLRAWTVPNLKRHEEDLAPFSGYLQQSPGLTRDGRRMFETLRDKVAR
jgi:HEXXH motif-containing protein